jgi:hypothetical protein
MMKKATMIAMIALCFGMSSLPAMAVYSRGCPRPGDGKPRSLEDQFALLINDTLGLAGNDQEIACGACGVGACAVEVPYIDSATRSKFTVYSNGKVSFGFVKSNYESGYGDKYSLVCQYSLSPETLTQREGSIVMDSTEHVMVSSDGDVNAACETEQATALKARAEQIAVHLSSAAALFYSSIQFVTESCKELPKGNGKTCQIHEVGEPVGIERAKDELRKLKALLGQ